MAGRLRHKLTLQSRVETVDAYGDAVLSYTAIGTEWGSIEALSLREQQDAQQTRSTLSHRITMRSNPTSRTLTAEDRIILSLRTFDVVGVVDPDGRGRWLEVRVMEHL